MTQNVDVFDMTDMALWKGMQGAALRQQALSNNIANVDTPGYARQDVDFHATLQAAMDSADSGKAVADTSFSIQTDSSQPLRYDGNSVDIDKEGAAQAQNGMEYETMAQIAKARIAIVKSAMGVS